jgi:hypothetical protein
MDPLSLCQPTLDCKDLLGILFLAGDDLPLSVDAQAVIFSKRRQEF